MQTVPLPDSTIMRVLGLPHPDPAWPDGCVCRTCSDRAVRTRGTCPGCGQDRALPGLRPGDGAAICTTCAEFSQTFDCSRCGFEGKRLGGRLCERCTLADRLTTLLDDGTGRVRPELKPLFDLLVAMNKPSSGPAWPALRRDQPGNASFQRWLPGHLADIPDLEHAKTIRLFATWRVLPRLRARAARDHITPSVRRFAAEQIKHATASLAWPASWTADSRTADSADLRAMRHRAT